MSQKINDIGFIERIQRLVDAAGGQAALARLADISQQNVSRYLSGAEPRMRHLVSIAKAANCSKSYCAYSAAINFAQSLGPWSRTINAPD